MGVGMGFCVPVTQVMSKVVNEYCIGLYIDIYVALSQRKQRHSNSYESRQWLVFYFIITQTTTSNLHAAQPVGWAAVVYWELLQE